MKRKNAKLSLPEIHNIKMHYVELPAEKTDEATLQIYGFDALADRVDATALDRHCMMKLGGSRRSEVKITPMAFKNFFCPPGNSGRMLLNIFAEIHKKPLYTNVQDRIKYFHQNAGGTLYLADDIPIAISTQNIIIFASYWMADQFSAELERERPRVKANDLFPDCYKFVPVANTITLGCDPELSGYLTEDYTQRVPANTTIKDAFDTQWGMDGNNSVFELRPEPGNTPEEITENTRKCLLGLAMSLGMRNSEAPRPKRFEVGGGFAASLGGHIHIGVPGIKGAETNQLNNSLLTHFDNYIYYPIKQRMTGAQRSWGGGYNFTSHAKKDEIIKVYPDKVSKASRFTDYDTATSFRRQAHGIEYRSPCSFIIDPELTRLIFKLAQEITRVAINEEDFEFEDTPKGEDYLKFLTPEETTSFFRYINGDKRDAFLTDTMLNWGIDLRKFECLGFRNWNAAQTRCAKIIVGLGDALNNLPLEAMRGSYGINIMTVKTIENKLIVTRSEKWPPNDKLCDGIADTVVIRKTRSKGPAALIVHHNEDAEEVFTAKDYGDAISEAVRVSLRKTKVSATEESPCSTESSFLRDMNRLAFSAPTRPRTIAFGSGNTAIGADPAFWPCPPPNAVPSPLLENDEDNAEYQEATNGPLCLACGEHCGVCDDCGCSVCECNCDEE